jgi:hypothetical protein
VTNKLKVHGTLIEMIKLSDNYIRLVGSPSSEDLQTSYKITEGTSWNSSVLKGSVL